MTATIDFITELFRAGNGVGKLTPFERRRLIDRAIATIRDMREQVNFSAPAAAGDVLAEIDAIGRDIAVVPDQLVAMALLELADMIRTLKIALDAKNEVLNEGDVP